MPESKTTLTIGGRTMSRGSPGLVFYLILGLIPLFCPSTHSRDLGTTGFFGTESSRIPELIATDIRRGPSSTRPEFVLSLRYARVLGSDFVQALTAPVRWNNGDWEHFSLLSTSVVGTAVVLDIPIRETMQRNRNDFTNSVADRFNNFGFNYPTWVLTGFYLTGLVLGDNTAQEVGLDGLAATLIASNVITPSLKRGVGRYRPYRDEGPFEFGSFSGHDSWPSGHSTRAFVTAAVIASHYRQKWVQYTAYAIAAMVAFARVDYDVHWASDVLAGAIIGISVGRGVVRYNCRLRYN